MRRGDDKGLLQKECIEALPCHVNDDERLDYSRQIGRMCHELGLVQAEKKETTARLGSQEKRLNGEISRMGKILDTGVEPRDVSCTLYFDYDGSVAKLYRNDTGEFVSSRPLTREEKQMRLPDL